MCAFLVLRRAKLCAHTLKASAPCLPLPKRNFSSKMILSEFGKCDSDKLRFFSFARIVVIASLDATGGASAAPTKRKICQYKSCTIDINTDKRSPDRERERKRKEWCEWLKR